MRVGVCLLLVLFLGGCNTGVAFSILGDLVSLRVERTQAGEKHVEDIFKDDESGKDIVNNR